MEAVKKSSTLLKVWITIDPCCVGSDRHQSLAFIRSLKRHLHCCVEQQSAWLQKPAGNLASHLQSPTFDGVPPVQPSLWQQPRDDCRKKPVCYRSKKFVAAHSAGPAYLFSSARLIKISINSSTCPQSCPQPACPIAPDQMVKINLRSYSAAGPVYTWHAHRKYQAKNEVIKEFSRYSKDFRKIASLFHVKHPLMSFEFHRKRAFRLS